MTKHAIASNVMKSAAKEEVKILLLTVSKKYDCPVKDVAALLPYEVSTVYGWLNGKNNPRYDGRLLTSIELLRGYATEEDGQLKPLPSASDAVIEFADAADTENPEPKSRQAGRSYVGLRSRDWIDTAMLATLGVSTFAIGLLFGAVLAAYLLLEVA